MTCEKCEKPVGCLALPQGWTDGLPFPLGSMLSALPADAVKNALSHLPFVCASCAGSEIPPDGNN